MGPFLLLAAHAQSGSLLPMDLPVTQAVQSLVQGTLLLPLFPVHYLGQRPAVVTYGATTVLGLWIVRLRLESLLLAAGLVAASSNGAIKEWVRRLRPDEASVRVSVEVGGEYGFPSGDAQFFTIFFGLLFAFAPVLAPSRGAIIALRVCCSLLLVSAGLTRVALGVHWPSDVLGGYLLGGFILWGLLAVYERRSGSAEQPRTPPRP